MPIYHNLIIQKTVDVFIGIFETILGKLISMLNWILICPVLIVILNIFTNNELIMIKIIDSYIDSFVLIGGIFGCV